MEHSFFITAQAYFLIFILFFMFMGVFLKFYSILIAILSFPTYLVLYVIEFFVPSKKKKIIRFFSISIPSDDKPKRFMNTAGALVTLLVISPLNNYSKINLKQGEQFTSEHMLVLYEKVINAGGIYVIFLSIITIYLISYYYADEDINSPWAKIENLSIPTLWKTIVKGL